jgi:hypothetical protein
MAKRFTDTGIWKTQRWFRKLKPLDKLAFCYIKDQCDHAGIWKIDCSDLMEDLGLDSFDLKSFIESVNTEYDKITGKKIEKIRAKIVNKGHLWLTGFIQFQYQGKDGKVNPEVHSVFSALTILHGLSLVNEGLDNPYITLSKPFNVGFRTHKDKDKDKDIDNTNSSKSSNSSSIRANKNFYSGKEIQPPDIEIDGYFHAPKLNGVGWVYPSIRGMEFDKECTKVLLTDGTWQKLSAQQQVFAKANDLKPDSIWKGKIK